MNWKKLLNMKWTVERLSIFLTIPIYMDYNQISYTNQMTQYIIYSDPIQKTTDFDHACIIADDYFNKTGYIVAVEEEEK